MQISAVPFDHLTGMWPAIAPLLERGLKHSGGRWTLESAYKSIVDGSRQLWIAFENNVIYAAALTSIENYPGRRILNYQLVGGYRMDLWYDHMSDVLHKFASDMGCDGIETICRRGFEKQHAKHGFKSTHVLMTKDI